MSKKLFLVMGSSGYYDDFEEWPVAIYADEELANQHAEKAERFSNDLCKKMKATGSSYSPEAYKIKKNNPSPFDDRLRDVGDTQYAVVEIDLLDEVPK